MNSVKSPATPTCFATTAVGPAAGYLAPSGALVRALLIATVLIFAGWTTAQAADAGVRKAEAPDLAKGETIAAGTCAACHGPTGNSQIPVNPILAGQHYDYLVKQLMDFKAVDGKPANRVNAVMAGFAAQLSEDDMRAVSAWYASQETEPAAATNLAVAEVGRQLYRGGDASRGLPSCAGCHGPAGAGIPGQYPGLAGQHPEYAAGQLTAFRQGTRLNSAMMNAIAAKLTDAEIAALADYVAGLR